MKTRHLLLIAVIVALPTLAVIAEDAGKAETTNPQTNSDTQNKAAVNNGCNCDRTSADLTKLVEEMNTATADKKLDAVTAVVNKLAQEFKENQHRIESKTANSEKSEMGMCEMMMGMHMKGSGDNREGDQEHHH
ncbi:MAG: hypothetical protein JOZ08_19590 [Verrucomicrobia bacterium]|nr:hypothetical protein [Verrucomicrobiota bacterium]